MRTIYRDIDMLSSEAAPVCSATGRGGGTHLLDSFVLEKSLLSKQKIQEVLFGVHSLAAIWSP